MSENNIPDTQEVFSEELKQQWLEKVKIKNPTSEDGFGWGAKHYNTCLHKAPEQIKKDRDINLAAALEGEEHLWNIHNIWKNDKDFILEIINKNYKNNIYDSLGKDLKNDVELFKILLTLKDKFFWGISKELATNKDAMLEIMKEQDIFTLLNKATDNSYELEKEFVELKLKHDPNYYKNLRKRMYNYFSHPKRKEFLLSIFKSSNNKEIYNALPDKFKEDLDFIHILLDKSHYNIGDVPEVLRNDKAFMSYAINKYNCSLDKSSKLLHQDEQLVALMVEKDGKNLIKFPYFQKNEKMIQLAFKTYKEIDLLHVDSLENKNLVLQFLEVNPKNAKALLTRDRYQTSPQKELYIKRYLNDIDVMRIAVAYDNDLLKFSHELKNNDELCQIAVAASGKVEHLSDEMFKNRSLVLQLLSKGKENCSSAVNNNQFLILYKNDQLVAREIIKFVPESLHYFPQLACDKSFVLYALEQGLKEGKSIDSSLYNDKEVALELVKAHPENYNLLPLKLRNDLEVATTSLAKHQNYHQMINRSDLSHSMEFHISAMSIEPTVYNFIPPFLKQDLRLTILYLEYEKEQSYFRIPEELQKKYKTSNIEDILSMLRKESLEQQLGGTENKTERKLKL